MIQYITLHVKKYEKYVINTGLDASCIMWPRGRMGRMTREKKYMEFSVFKDVTIYLSKKISLAVYLD